MHMCVYMCVQLGGTYENEDVKRRLYVCVSWVIRLVGTYNPKLHCHIVKKFEFEHHTKFLTVHACKKAVCDWCQSAETECTYLPCEHVIHSVRDVVCRIL